VFIRGFRVARTFKILPKHLKAAAGPSPDLDDYDLEPEIDVVSIPATSKVKDSILLFDYLRGFKVSGSPSHTTGLSCRGKALRLVFAAYARRS
jgi:hypothetical protein